MKPVRPLDVSQTPTFDLIYVPVSQAALRGFVVARGLEATSELDALRVYLEYQFELAVDRFDAHAPFERYTMACGCEVRIGFPQLEQSAKAPSARVARDPCQEHSRGDRARSPFYWDGHIVAIPHHPERLAEFSIVEPLALSA